MYGGRDQPESCGLRGARVRGMIRRSLGTMVIYGTALLSACLLLGLLVGRAIGWMVGVEANIGGVGLAMLALILCCDRLQAAKLMRPPTEQGIQFWSSVYIPVVVAMAASQNVFAALSGGAVAVVAGVLSVAACYSHVPVIGRIGSKEGGKDTADE